MVIFSNNGKKLIYIILVVLCCLLFVACVPFTSDPHYGKRPYNYPDTTWICTEPEIIIYVGDTPNNDMRCFYMCDGELQEFILDFLPGDKVVAILTDESELFSGHCRFGKNKFKISISEEYVWNGQYRDLVFTRQQKTGDGLREPQNAEDRGRFCVLDSF